MNGMKSKRKSRKLKGNRKKGLTEQSTEREMIQGRVKEGPGTETQQETFSIFSVRSEESLLRGINQGTLFCLSSSGEIVGVEVL